MVAHFSNVPELSVDCEQSSILLHLMHSQPTLEEKLMIYEGKFVNLQLRDGKQLKGTIRRKVDGNWEIAGSDSTAPNTAEVSVTSFAVDEVDQFAPGGS
jgi:hypothetical protein